MPWTNDISKKRNVVDPVDMKAAVKVVLVENMSYGSASRSFNMKQQTLHKQVMNFRKKYGDTTFEIVNKYIYRNNYYIHRIVDNRAERDLILYIQTVAKMKHGLTKQKLSFFITMPWQISLIYQRVNIKTMQLVSSLCGRLPISMSVNYL